MKMPQSTTLQNGNTLHSKWHSSNATIFLVVQNRMIVGLWTKYYNNTISTEKE